VPAKELRRRVHDDVGAVFDGTAQRGRRDGGVHHEWHPGVAGHRRQPREVGDLSRGVGDDLGKDQPCPVGDCGGVVAGVRSGDERRVDAEASQRYVQLRHGAAVQAARGDDVIAGTGERGEHRELGGQSARGGDRAEPAFEAGDAFLERGHRRIADPAVDVSVLLQGEQVGGVVGVGEDEAGVGVDGNGACAGTCVGPLAGVDRAGSQPVGSVGHGCAA
jgi:hypothetical protein